MNVATASTRLPSEILFVAMPILKLKDGAFCPGQPVRVQTQEAALIAAERLSRLHGGALALSKSKAPAASGYGPAIVLARYGETAVADQPTTKVVQKADIYFRKNDAISERMRSIGND